MAKSRIDSSDFNDAEWLAGLGIDSVVDCKDEQERWYVVCTPLDLHGLHGLHGLLVLR
jgi:hypothetical protein